MKKYFRLLAITLMCGMFVPFTACDDDNEEIIELPTQNKSLLIESLSPAYGYPGDEFDVVGKNFASASELIKVTMGDKNLKVVSATDDRITVMVPADATTGRVKVSLLGKEVVSEELFKVLGYPSIESVSRNWGFIGDEITFSGSLLGTCAGDIRVSFASSRVTAEVSEWDENSFTVIVPTDAATGAVKVFVHTQSVNVPFDEFIVRQHGRIVSVNPGKVMAGDKFTVNGDNLGQYEVGCALTVGAQEAVIESWSETEIVAVIPEDNSLEAGKTYAVSVTTAHETVPGDVNLRYVGTYGEIPILLKTPFMMTKVNEEVEFAARNLPSSLNGVKASVNGVDAEVVAIGSESVTIRIPGMTADVSDAAVELTIPSGDVYSEAVINVAAGTGDVTDLVLVNAHAPFSSVDGGTSGFRTPAGWLFNDNMYAGDNLIMPLLYDNDFPHGVLGFWCHAWTDGLHKNYITNGKMYQTVSLPAGDYEIVADVAECNIIKGDLGVALGVSENELSDLTGGGRDFSPANEDAYYQNPDGSRAFVMISNRNVVRAETTQSPCTYTLVFKLHERKLVNIGLTATVTKKGGNGCSFDLRGLTFKSL